MVRKRSENIPLRNDKKGNKELMISVGELSDGTKKKYVCLYIGNTGQGNLPFIGMSDNKELVELAEKLCKIDTWSF